MRHDLDWIADKGRYPKRPFLKEQSIWAVYLYRLGRRLDARRVPPRRLSQRLYWLAFRFVETICGISLPKGCSIGPGLRIWHFGGIFIHPNTVIGSRCDLRHGVTIGNNGKDDLAPTIGDDVQIGAYAQIIGNIKIGNRVLVGAGSVVVKDVPQDSTVVGNPARVLSRIIRPQTNSLD